MRGRWRLPSLLITLGALALACNSDGGGATPRPAPPEPVRAVISDDGRLTLEIPPGAVDEDVEISVTSVPLDELPEQLRVLLGAGTGYRLEPDGLEFRKPVTVSLQLEAAELADQPANGTAAYGLVSLTAGGERETLDSLVTETRHGEATVTVRGKLRHLSWLGRTKGSLTVSLEEVSAEEPVGGTISVPVDARNTEPTGRVRLKGILGHFRALGGVSLTEISDRPAVPEGEDLPENVFVIPFDSLLEFDQGIAVTGEFHCDSPGLGSYAVDVFATSVVEVEGEVLTTGLTVIIDGLVNCAE